MIIILQSIYFFLPAYFANMAPVLFKKTFRRMAIPIDGGATYRGRRVLGDNKTWRGVLVGIVVAIFTILLQRIIFKTAFFRSLSLIDYSVVDVLWLVLLAFLMGLGALLGDAVKSFFKRGRKFKPGQSWFPFDQVDFAIGGLLLSSVLFFPGWWTVLIVLVASPILHVLARLAGYALKIDKSKF